VLWSATELYHVAGNRIAERWCACLWPVLPEVLARAELAAPPNAMLVRLVRLVVAPGEVQPQRSFGSSILLAVEAGVLDVKTGGLAAADDNATAEGRQPVTSGDDHVLAAGDHLLVSSGTSLAFHNGGGAAAVVLALAMLPFDADARDGLTFRWPDGAPPAETATVLVDGAVSRLPAGMATVTLGRMTLPAGVDLAPSVTTGPQLVFVESGDLQVVSPAEHGGLVPAGQGGFVPLEDVRALRGTGEGTVVFLAVTFESADP
jgi:hypothetical protein